MSTKALPALCSLDEFLQNDYDFIVVGGGTAGLVMAARLTENPDITVGVLEAGAANIGDPMIMMPAMYTQAIADPKYDWIHKTVPQTSFQNRMKDMPRGKGLGGSSAINFQMYVRGDSADYDDWEKLGNKGWGFKDLFPYFKKHEHFDDPKDYQATSNIALKTTFDPEYHGFDGPIHTSFSTWRLPLEKEWLEASATLGEKMTSPMDAWSGDHLGVFHSLSSIDRSPAFNGTRSYSTTGYLLPNASRPNLRVLTEALVTKLISSTDGSVTGVEFLQSGKSYSVKSKKEVILSAGVVKTPQLLELSGIGNPDVLSKAGIECVVENPRVGENFQDHPITGGVWELVAGEKTLDALQDPEELQKAIAEYTSSQSGPLSSGGAAMGFASYASLSTQEEVAALQKLIMTPTEQGYDHKTLRLLADSIADPNYASIQFVLLPAAVNIALCDDQKLVFQPMPDFAGKQGIFIGAAVARPLSQGTCHITTSNPLEDPAIDPAYLSHPADVEILQKGMEHVAKMVATSPLKEKIKSRFYPKAEVDMTTKEGREEYVKHNISTEYHICGSVPMGVEGVGAVDDRLKVRGSKGLRVVDASVIPVHVSGNIQATVYAIAEKAADMVKEDWGL